MGVAALAADFLDFNKYDSTLTLFLTALLLLGTMAVAGMVIVWLGRVMKRRPTSFSSTEELTRFRELYERGELGRDEYEKIKAKLVPRLRKDLNLPAPKPEAPPPDAPLS